MKTNFKKVLGLMMVGLSLASCSDKTLIGFDSQLDAITQLSSGSVDAAVIDSIMAGYYATTGDFKDKITVVNDLVLSSEEYGIATRKADVAFMDKINEGLIGTYTNGELTKIANYFGVTSSLAISASTTYSGSGTDNSWSKIVESGKIVVGYTVFAPIAYTDKTKNYANNEFTGFDTELAREVVSYLNTKYEKNLSIEFKEINWDSKETLLANGTIDLIWNGLTITDERKANMTISIPYLYNKQVAVVKKGDESKYTTKDSLVKATVGVESGSAGEDVVKEIKNIK